MEDMTTCLSNNAQTVIPPYSQSRTHTMRTFDRRRNVIRFPRWILVVVQLTLLMSTANALEKDVYTFDTQSMTGSTAGGSVNVVRPTTKPVTTKPPMTGETLANTSTIATKTPTINPTRVDPQVETSQPATTKPPAVPNKPPASNTPQPTPSGGCCAKCIGDTSQAEYTYDPLVFEQCQAAKGVCCFGCKPQDAFHPILDNCTYPDGVTPEVQSGDWIKFQWPQVTRVTYEFYQIGQRKTTTVRNSSAEAKVERDWFFICPNAPGKVVVRGWGVDSCLLASTEFTINVAKGDGSSQCVDRPPLDVNVANTKNDATKQCNLQRATINKVNGVDTCVCTAEWQGPPSCSGFPWWKIVITGCGGVAAAMSVAVSVRAYLKSRKNADDDHSDDIVVLGNSPFGKRGNDGESSEVGCHKPIKTQSSQECEF